MSFWFYRDSFGGKTYETLFGGPNGYEIDSKPGATNTPNLYLYSNGGRTGAYLTGKWNHVVFVRTPSDSRLYLNGALLITGTAGTNPAGSYYLGSRNNTSTQNFNGRIDELMIYNRALSTGEIQFLYASNLTKNTSNRRLFTTNRISFNSSFSYSGRIQDAVGYSSGTLARGVTIDGVPPSSVSILTPSSGGSFNTGNVQIRWLASIDTGAGMSGYSRMVSRTGNFSTVDFSGITTNTGININGLLDTTYYLSIGAYDIAGNANTPTVESFSLDSVPPTIGTPTIFTGYTMSLS